MNIKLVSKSIVSNRVRYLAEHLSNQELLINNGYEELTIIDYDFNVIKSFNVEPPLLMTFHYFSDNRQYFLWYCDDDSYACFIDLTKSDSKPLKYELPEGVILYPYYTWDFDKFVIAASKNTYFSYEIRSKKFQLFNNQRAEEIYPFFKELTYYDSTYRVLYYDFKNEIIIYRSEEENELNTIYIKHPIAEMNVQFKAPCKYIFRAAFLDGILVLVEEDNVIFYYLDQEFHRITNTKKHWIFRPVDIFKVDNEIYCLVSCFYFNNPKNNVIELYKIER